VAKLGFLSAEVVEFDLMLQGRISWNPNSAVRH